MKDLNIDDDLKLFGSNFFNTFQTSFMPINEPNPDSTYTLDIGDILNIQLIGQKVMMKILCKWRWFNKSSRYWKNSHCRT